MIHFLCYGLQRHELISASSPCILLYSRGCTQNVNVVWTTEWYFSKVSTSCPQSCSNTRANYLRCRLNSSSHISLGKYLTFFFFFFLIILNAFSYWNEMLLVINKKTSWCLRDLLMACGLVKLWLCNPYCTHAAQHCTNNVLKGTLSKHNTITFMLFMFICLMLVRSK